MTQIKVGDIEMEVYVEGAGPQVLLLAGVGSHAGTWGEPFLALLREHFQVIRPSNRGMGQTTMGEPPLTIRKMADDAAALLGELGIERADVFGYSMGGYIAQELAINHPQVVGRLLLGCTNCGGSHSVLQSPDHTASLARIMSSSPDDRTRGFCLVMVTEEFAATSTGFMDEIVGIHRSTSFDAFSAQMGAINAFDTYDRLPQIVAPTLLLHGDRDIMIPHENAAVLADRIPGATVHTIAGAGHMFMWERPEEAAGIVQQFLLPVAVPQA